MGGNNAALKIDHDKATHENLLVSCMHLLLLATVATGISEIIDAHKLRSNKTSGTLI